MDGEGSPDEDTVTKPETATSVSILRVMAGNLSEVA
jgi:hypothetical protein